MVRKKDLKYLNKTYQELFKIKRVLDSCITPEQFNNSTNWCNQIMRNWEFREQYLSNNAKNIILNTVINDLDKSYNANLKRIENNTNIEKEIKKPENIVIKGFC